MLLANSEKAVALVGFIILLFSQFPPDGSHRLDEGEVEDSPPSIE